MVQPGQKALARNLALLALLFLNHNAVGQTVPHGDHLTPQTLQTYIYSLRAARLFQDEGHDQLAMQLYLRALETHPSKVSLVKKLGNNVEPVGMGAYTEPFAGILNFISWRGATSQCPEARDGRRAVRAGQFALQLHPRGKAFYFDTIAAAYAESGDFDAAISTQKQAIASLVANSSSEAEFQARLALYKLGKPYRQPSETPLWPVIKDRSGHFEVKGRFTKLDGNKVTILKEAGGETVVPIDRLAQRYYDALRRALDENDVITDAEKWDLFDEGLPFSKFTEAAEVATRAQSR